VTGRCLTVRDGLGFDPRLNRAETADRRASACSRCANVPISAESCLSKHSRRNAR
jgi:hypothetical protein